MSMEDVGGTCTRDVRESDREACRSVDGSSRSFESGGLNDEEYFERVSHGGRAQQVVGPWDSSRTLLRIALGKDAKSPSEHDDLGSARGFVKRHTSESTDKGEVIGGPVDSVRYTGSKSAIVRRNSLHYCPNNLLQLEISCSMTNHGSDNIPIFMTAPDHPQNDPPASVGANENDGMVAGSGGRSSVEINQNQLRGRAEQYLCGTNSNVKENNEFSESRILPWLRLSELSSSGTRWGDDMLRFSCTSLRTSPTYHFSGVSRRGRKNARSSTSAVSSVSNIPATSHTYIDEMQEISSFIEEIDGWDGGRLKSYLVSRCGESGLEEI